MINNQIILKCSKCHKELELGNYICPNKDGIIEVHYEYKKVGVFDDLIMNKPGIWKFSKLLPKVENPLTLGEGNTPLIKSTKLGPSMNVELYYKNEGQNPTGSFKDRAAAVMLSIEKDLKHNAVTTVSSGNASGAIASYSAAADIQCYIFMVRVTQEKLINTSSYWPKIFFVEVETAEAFSLAEEASKKFGWKMLTTTAYHNPFTIEGYKTIAFELFEQNGLPDVVISPMGSGSLILGIWKGFYELSGLGIIDSIPRIIGVQSEGCNPIFQAYQDNKEHIRPSISPKTIAGGINTNDPGICGEVALKRIRGTGGSVVQVSDDEILSILHKLPKEEGIFGGPTGVVSVAGVIKSINQGCIKKGEKVACLISESGFKDLGAYKSSLQDPIKIKPDLADIEKFLNSNEN